MEVVSEEVEDEEIGGGELVDNVVEGEGAIGGAADAAAEVVADAVVAEVVVVVEGRVEEDVFLEVKESNQFVRKPKEELEEAGLAVKRKKLKLKLYR